MDDQKTKSRKRTALRRRAEEQLQGQEEVMAELTPEKIRRLVHELRVYQVELEIQNEDLRQTQVELEESRSLYRDLYDFAPLSYFTLDDSGRILKSNLTAASLLGVERGNLIGKIFLQLVARDDSGIFDRFLTQILENQGRQSCEVRLKARSEELEVRLDGLLWQDARGRTLCRVTATDISNLRAAERGLRRHRDRLEQLVLERTASLEAQTLKLEVQREELLRVTDELERERARLRTTLEQMPGGIVIAEAHSGKLLLVNRQMSTIFGRSLSLEDGLEFLVQFQAFHADGRPLKPGECPLTQALAMGQVAKGEEIEVIRGDGARRTLWVSGAPVRDRLGRTIAAVATYQDITARKQAEANLEESRSQSVFLADLLESAAQPFGVGFLDGRLGLFNAAFPQLLGYSREEFAALNWMTDITPPEWREPEAAKLEELQRTGQPVRYEKEYRRKDGALVPVEMLVHLRRDEQGRPSYYYAFMTDITARKAAEAEIWWLASFPRLNVNPVLEIDLTGTITFSNQAALTALRSGDEAAELEAFLPEDLEDILATVLEQKETIFYREVRFKDAVYAENIAFVEPFKVIRIYATDITALKRSDKALRAANAQLSAIIENSPLTIMRLDEEGTILSCNPAGERMFGWSATELVGQKIPMVPPDELEMVRDILRRVSQGERFTGLERRRLRRDGSLVDLSVSVSPMYDEIGTFAGIVNLMEDITPRKEAEAALRRSNERLDLLAQTAAHLLASVSPQQEVEWLCQKVMAFLGCEAFFNFLADENEGRLHLNAHAGIPAAEAKRIEWLDYGAAVCGCAAREGRRIVTEHIQTTPDPRTELVKSYGIQAYACHPLIAEGRVLGTLSFGTRNRSSFSADDLALMRAVADQVAIAMDRKNTEAALRQAHDELEQRVRVRTADLRQTVEQLQFEVKERLVTEEMLRQSEARFRSAFDQSPVGAVIVDHKLGIQRVNQAFCQIIGYSAEELASMNVADITHPGDLPKSLETARRFLAGEMDDARMEERNIRKDGAVIWVDLSVSVINPGDQPGYFLGIVQDITARKTAEKTLAQHAALVRDLYDNAPCGYHSLDPEGRFVQVNNTELAWLGYSREEMLGGMHFADLLTPASLKTFQKNFPGFRKRGWVSDLEFELFRKDGTILPVLLNATAITDDAGHYVMSRSTMVDITERRRSQAGLEAERRRFFDMLEKIPAYVALIGPDCTIPYANREFVQRFGEPGNRLSYEMLFGIDAPYKGCKALEVLKTKTLQIWEWTGPDGHNYQIHDHPFIDVDGSPLVLELGVDISGLKAAEAGILRQSAILSAINRVFREFLICKSEEELGRTCLTVAEELTGSAFGLIGEVNQDGNLVITAFSNPDWAARQMGEPEKERINLLNLGMRGLQEGVINDGSTVIVNSPATHSSAVGLPAGYPPLTSYLGVPFKHGDKVIGLIALANKPGGYSLADQEAMESLSAAIVEGLMRFRAETRVAIVSRLYLFLSKVNEAIVRVQDQAALFQEICRIAVEEGRFKMAWVGMVDAQGDAVKAVAQYGLDKGYLERIIISIRKRPESLGPTGTAVREDRFDICNDIASDPRMVPWREEALQRGYRSSGAFPLRIGGKVLGSLTLYAGVPGFFTSEEVRLLESLAHDVSFAMESLERDALRRQAEVALQESEGRLRSLAAQLIDSQETERNRIALELHDDLGQSLTVLTMQLRAITKMLPEDQNKTRESCNQTVDYVYQIIENVRRLSRDLRPSLLEDLGLPTALRHLAETFHSYHGIDISLDMDDVRGFFAPQEEINIYRIFQESLTNIAKHAQATQVSVIIRKLDKRVSFRVEDDGKGFDMDHILDRDAPRKGLGLVAMEERVRMIGGSLEIWSQEGKGTRISFMLPMRT